MFINKKYFDATCAFNALTTFKSSLISVAFYLHLQMDRVLEAVGDFGPSQWKFVAILCAMRTIQGMFLFHYPFLVYDDVPITVRAATVFYLINCTKLSLFKCVVESGEKNVTYWKASQICDESAPNCQEVIFDTSHNSSLISEWNLTCDRKWIASLSYSLNILGGVSMPLMGIFGDKFGRKQQVFGCLGLTSFFQMLSSFVPE